MLFLLNQIIFKIIVDKPHSLLFHIGYKIAQVPRDFSELRQISLAGNMLSDHMSKSYYEALLECKSVRRAPEDLPEWTGFSEENTW